MYISIENMTKIIKGKTILDNITLEMEKGKIYGIQGINGSGKTMLMRAACGLIRPTKGTVKIGGKILGKESSFPESVGILIEKPSFISHYTGYRNLQLLAELKGVITKDEVKACLKKVGLDPEDKRTFRKYSLGMKQRLGIACAIMEHSDFIILDEPFNALDEDGVALIRNLILKEKEKGSLIMLSCHDKEELNLLSDEIFHIKEGKITKPISEVKR